MAETITIKERPLLFSAPMVRAILSGAKTQTRRLVISHPNNPIAWTPDPDCSTCLGNPYWAKTLSSWKKCSCNTPPIDNCPHGKPGDRLWVRETWQKSGMGWGNNLPVGKVHYLATDNGEWRQYWGNWKPSIHMPRWASRITLEITDVRVERVQSITPEDAEAEGVAELVIGRTGGTCVYDPVKEFARLWDAINGKRDGGKYRWENNCWVWVLTFRRLDGNVAG